VELVKSEALAPCDVLGGDAVQGYSGFRKEKFNFTVEGVWPHPHGAMTMNLKKDPPVKFASFTTTAPAWTLMSEFVVPNNTPGTQEGSIPAGPITQANEIGEGDLHLLIGGYRTNQASVLERRHEMMSLAQGWQDDKGRLAKLVEIGKEAKKVLRGKLYFAVHGNKDKGLKGIGAAIHETAEKLFYTRTESLIHETFSNELTFKEWASARSAFAKQLTDHCRAIFEELTDPYAMKPELIPVIAWARRSLNIDLKKLMEEA
jgi:CRISPR system Cascade subunit CasA